MPSTIAEVTHHALAQLRDRSDAPVIDVQQLLLHVLNLNESSYLITHPNQTLTSLQEQTFAALCARRANGEPLAYLLGSWGFYGRSFLVTPDVLIPRPSTEALIDEALRLIDQLYGQAKRPLILADIGTGSGCIAITLMLAAPEKIARMYATDISPAALAVAQKNAHTHGVEQAITFVQGDMLAPLVNTNIDLIVSNPPYVPTAELTSLTALEKRGLAFEPRQALDGGTLGQDFSQVIKKYGLPAIVEVTSGSIDKYNFGK